MLKITVSCREAPSAGSFCRAAMAPTQAASVGLVQTFKAEKVSIGHAGMNDSPFGMRPTAPTIFERLQDHSVPTPLPADDPNVHFHVCRPGIGRVAAEMH